MSDLDDLIAQPFVPSWINDMDTQDKILYFKMMLRGAEKDRRSRVKGLDNTITFYEERLKELQKGNS